MSGFTDGAERVRALGGDDAKVAGRDFMGIGGGADSGGEIGRTSQLQAALGNRLDVLLPDVVGIDLDTINAREVRRENSSNGSATDNADFHYSALPLLLGGGKNTRKGQ